MIRTVLGAMLIMLALAIVAPASAASFDCTKATTAFEKAICDNPQLSIADDTLAVAFATAIGGLDKAAVTRMRADQHAWLDFAAASCTDTGEPLADGESYTKTDQLDCLDLAYNDRIRVLETSRMLGGHRFAVASRYAELPDPDAATDPDYYWKVATHVVSYPVLQGKGAAGFNAAVEQRANEEAGSLATEGDVTADAQSDSNVLINFDEAVSNRVSLKVSTYWFGHGAAHGDYSVSYLHYRLGSDALLAASDLFTGDSWGKTLTDLSIAALKQTYGEDYLQLDSGTDVGSIVTDPNRWSFVNEAGLTIQFEPYEVAAYAMGAPTVLIPWDALSDMLAEGADSVRYGS